MRTTSVSPLPTIAACFLALFSPLPPAAAEPFIRGDANGDQKVDVSDALTIFGYLFRGLGREVQCHDALDTNDNGRLDITDGIHLLVYLFHRGDSPRAPQGDCGWDMTNADALGCADSPCKFFLPRQAGGGGG